MDWWVWVLVGLGLLGLEMLTPGGFYVTVLSLVLFRRRLVAWSHGGGQAPPVDTLLGEIATPLEDLPPGALGKAELRGSAWTAHNVDARPLAKGQRGRVVRVDGLTLDIRAE